MPSDDPREVVSLASRVLAHADLGDLVWGHASVRDPHGRGAWVKASGWGMEEVTPDRVHLVDSLGTVLEGEGERHSEYPIHTEIMAARPDVCGVVHVHPPAAMALAATSERLRPVSHEATFFMPFDVPRSTATTDLIRTPELGRKVAAELDSAPALMLVNHGVVAVGRDLQTAAVTAILLERAAQRQMMTHALDGWPTWTDPQESLSKREHVYHDKALRQVWDYLVRRLPCSPAVG